MRDEKDPLRAAMAARLLNKSSKIRVFHLGKAHNDTWAIAAKKEQMENPRYHWLGEVTAGRVRREFIKTHLMVLSSNQEEVLMLYQRPLLRMFRSLPLISQGIPVYWVTNILGCTQCVMRKHSHFCCKKQKLILNF